jgi:lysophospholipase L1-like esterase
MQSHYLFAEIIALTLFSLVPFRVKGETDSMKTSARDAWTRLLEEGYRKNAIYAWVENDPALPNVLLYGDSISIGYTQRVREKLKGKANVYRLYRNGRHSGVFVEYMTAMHKSMRDPGLDHPWTFDWDVIHFNVGLHDLLRPSPNGRLDAREGRQSNPIPVYKKNLEAIIAYLKTLAPDATLIFATTTPVPANTPHRLDGDAAQYNEAAREILKNHPDILVNDLFGFTKPKQPEWWAKPGDVHYNPVGQQAQGDEVARVILKALESRNRPKKRTGLILYSDDLTHIVYIESPYHKKGEPFREEMMVAAVDEVADAGADIHMLQPGLGWVPLWKSKALPFAENYAWVKQRYGGEDGHFDAYMLNGGDIVAAFVKRCRERGIQPYISLRMNDYHMKELIDFTKKEIEASSRPTHPLTIYASRFQLEHKHWRLRPDPEGLDKFKEAWEVNLDRGLRVRTRRARVLNWANPEVRQHKLDFIAELCENYDIDGFELDFMRTAHLFRKEETTRQQRLEIMTSHIRKVREILDRSARDGQRRRLCVRIPHHIPAHDEMGVDIAAWHAAGVDMFNLSCHYVNQQQTSMPELIAQAPNAEFFLELTQSTESLGSEPPPYNHRMTTREQFATSAAVAAAQGASGVSLFNFMYYRLQAKPHNGVRVEPPFEVFKRMKKAMQSPPAKQHYYFSRGSDVWGIGGFRMPKHMRRGETETLRMTMTPPQGGWKTPGRLRIRTNRISQDLTFKLLFNGHVLSETDAVYEPFPNPYNTGSALGEPQARHAWIVPAKHMRKGINDIQITQTRGETVSIVYVDMGIPDSSEADTKE